MSLESPVPVESRHYGKVLRMVLWGEPRENVFDALEANGITGPLAERLYRDARRERIATIRGAYTKKAIIGGLMILGAVGLFAIFWFGIGLMSRGIIALSAVVAVFGAHKLIDGMVGYAFAHKREGSVTEDI